MRVIIPKSLRATILQEHHQNHPGIVRMKILARSYLWWPKLNLEIEKQVKCSESYQCVKGHPSAAPLHPWLWPSRPWQRIHLCFAGPFFKKCSWFVLTLTRNGLKWLKWEALQLKEPLTNFVSYLKHMDSQIKLSPTMVLSSFQPSLLPS